MNKSYIMKALQNKTYLLTFVATTLVVGTVYLGVLTNTKAYNTFGWAFALIMPVLVGLIVAIQAYNHYEAKSCPVSSVATGTLGGIIGIATVGCSACPAILLGWFGLAAAVPGIILSSNLLKTASLVLLLLSLIIATRGRT